MRLVSSQSERDIRRNKTREQLVAPLRQLAANLLGIVRGAGKPDNLGDELTHLMSAFAAYVDAHGALPPAHEISDILDPDKAFKNAHPRIDERRKEAQRAFMGVDPGISEREEALKIIRDGSLQVAASMLVNQPRERRSGEYAIQSGMRAAEIARAKSDAFYSDPRRPKRSLAETLEFLRRSKR